MVANPTFTLDELLADLRINATTPMEGYKTTAEWAQLLGVCTARMQKILQIARKEGKLLLAQERHLCIDGRLREIPVYAILLDPS